MSSASSSRYGWSVRRKDNEMFNVLHQERQNVSVGPRYCYGRFRNEYDQATSEVKAAGDPLYNFPNQTRNL